VGAQLEIEAVVASTGKGTWGGKRPGAGRKLAPGARASVPHRTRPEHKRRNPVHVTLRARQGLPSLRAQRVLGMLQSVLITQRKRKYAGEFQVVHFSVQGNHLHMIVESEDRSALRAGVAGFVISFAKRLNMLLRRSGKVWAHRWHGKALETPRQVRNALVYVFANQARHGTVSFGDGAIDLYSSAVRFDGWRRKLPFTEETHDLLDATGAPWLRLRWPRAPTRTWLLGRGWRTHGLIDPREITQYRRRS
jgi:REP element-mobilizing transposase RayT